MAAEISRGNETIGMERDEARGEGGMRGEGGSRREERGFAAGPRGWKIVRVSPSTLSFSRGSRQFRVVTHEHTPTCIGWTSSFA